MGTGEFNAWGNPWWTSIPSNILVEKQPNFCPQPDHGSVTNGSYFPRVNAIQGIICKANLLRRGLNICYINLLCKVSAGAKLNESIWQRTSARCMLISCPSLDLLALANCIFLRSNFIFSKKRSKSFYLEHPLKPMGLVLHALFISWKKNNLVVDSNQLNFTLQELSFPCKSELK